MYAPNHESGSAIKSARHLATALSGRCPFVDHTATSPLGFASTWFGHAWSSCAACLAVLCWFMLRIASAVVIRSQPRLTGHWNRATDSASIETSRKQSSAAIENKADLPSNQIILE